MEAKTYNEKNVDCLAPVLAKHFENASEAQCIEAAQRIERARSRHAVFDEMRLRDRRPEQDKAALLKAAKDVHKAAEKIAALGYHGSKSISGAAQRIKPELAALPEYLQVNSLSLSNIVQSHLQTLARDFEDAAEAIDCDSASIFDNNKTQGWPTKGYRHGPPSDTGADFVTFACIREFEDFTKTRATRRVHAIPAEGEKGQTPYGPLHDFVSDTLAALGIEASADNRIRDALSSLYGQKTKGKLP